MKLPVSEGVKEVILERHGRRLFYETFRLPGGKTDDFFVFDTLKKAKPVIVFPLTRDREVVAIRQFRYGANAVVIELPGGLPNPGEAAEDTLGREFLEETGYRPGRVLPFNQKTMWFEPASLRVQYVPLLALDCTFVKESDPDKAEVIEVVKVPYEEWIGLVEDGSIRDDKTIAITFLADLYLRRNPL